MICRFGAFSGFVCPHTGDDADNTSLVVYVIIHRNSIRPSGLRQPSDLAYRR